MTYTATKRTDYPRTPAELRAEKKRLARLAELIKFEAMNGSSEEIRSEMILAAQRLQRLADG